MVPVGEVSVVKTRIAHITGCITYSNMLMQLHRFVVLCECKIGKIAKFDLRGRIRRHFIRLARNERQKYQQTKNSDFRVLSSSTWLERG